MKHTFDISLLESRPQLAALFDALRSVGSDGHGVLET